MQPNNPAPQTGWSETSSQKFIDYGRYFVPDRERQSQIIVDLVPRFEQPGTIVELCCGEGLLAEMLLEQRPAAHVLGLDGSTEMLRRAAQRLARFGERFVARPFDLMASSWRQIDPPAQAVVSSLAIHHLDGDQKQALFRDVFAMLAPGGAFIIADVMLPAQPLGREVAAKAWDEAVRERALQLDGTLAGFGDFERLRWNMYRHADTRNIDKPSRLLDQLKWMEAAGFSGVDVFWMRAGHAIFGGWK